MENTIVEHLEEDYTKDYLPGTTIYFYQHKAMFRSNTDTALLGKFMEVRKKDTVLDIGTNNGALLLYANLHQPKALIGVELQKEACALARYNLAYHHIDNATIIEGNILDITLPPVSCIVCNPPYFKVEDPQKTNQNEQIAKARHETQLDLAALIQKVKVLLEDRGRIYMVHRADRFIDIACMMREAGLEIKKAQFVYDEAKEDARSVLIEAMKSGRPHCRIIMPHIITR